MINVLERALTSISSVTPPVEVEIVTHETRVEMGVVYDTLAKRTKLWAHLQPVTPSELKKYSDSTLDLARVCKFFFLENEARVLSALQLEKSKSVVIYDGREYGVFGVRDWFAQNGWVCVYASLKSQ